MGLFSSSPPPSTSPSLPTPSTDGAFIAPSRSSRASCWAARDAFFACLDAHNIVDSIRNKDEAGKHCGAEDQGLGRECAQSWVTYFKQRRVMEHKKQQTLESLQREGARPMEEAMGPLSSGGLGR